MAGSVHPAWYLRARDMRRRAVLLALCVAAGCRAPTQIELVLETDVNCADHGGLTVTVGALDRLSERPPAAATARCDGSGRLGTLVVTPSAERDAALAIQVVSGFGQDVESCTAGFGPGCIVARRALRFIPHEPLVLPIFLAASCAGVVCGATQTCVGGHCVSASLDSRRCAGEGGCDETALLPGGRRPRAVPECGDTGGFEKGSPWPVTGACPTRSGRSAFAGPRDPRVLWTHDAQSLRGGPIVAADGTVFVSAATVLAISRDGERLESFEADPALAPGIAPALRADGSLVVSTNSEVVALDRRGAELWRAPLPEGADVSLNLDASGRIYGSSCDGYLHAFDGDGARAWQFDLQGCSFSAPALSPDGTIYAPSFDGSALFAVDSTGTEKWRFALTGSESAGPAVGPDGTVFVGDDDGSLHAVASDGSLRWSFLTEDYVTSLIALRPGGGAFVSSGGTLWAVEGDGTLAWRLDEVTTRSVAVDAEGVAYVGVGKDLVALDQAGATVWRLPVEGGVGSVAIGVGGVLYAATGRGVVAVGE